MNKSPKETAVKRASCKLIVEGEVRYRETKTKPLIAWGKKWFLEEGFKVTDAKGETVFEHVGTGDPDG